MGLVEDHDRRFIGIARAANFEMSGEAFSRRAFFKLCGSTA
jgi:hypothetical protein